MTTRADLERLSRGLDEATRMALAALSSAFGRLDLSSPEGARDALLVVMPAIAAQYGDLAATSAAEWYERLRAAAVGGTYSAILADGPSEVQVVQATRWAVGGLWGAEPAGVQATLGGVLGRLIGQQGKETVHRNVAVDPAKPRWARVPGPGGCCAWCSMLASRGFVYASAATAGKGHAYHDHCSCVPTPLWKGQAHRIDGYDPRRLRATYDEARAAVKASGATVDDKAIAAEMRRLSPETVTDGVTPAE